jgi:hypothetical protein
MLNKNNNFTKKNNSMIRFKTLTTACLIALSSFSFAQATMTNGPALTNDRDNKMNRMLNGDDNSYYAYRVRSKGKGTSFFIEKYDKKSLKPIFSKEISLEEENRTKIEDVLYANGKVFIFRRQYDKKADKMSLFYQTVTSDGTISDQLKEVTSVNTDHYEFVNFDIIQNPSKTMECASEKKLWTKTSSVNGSDDFTGFIGFMLDDNDNIYYGYSYEIKNSSEKAKMYGLSMGIIEASSQNAIVVELPFDDNYLVSDIEFNKNNNNEITIGGFLKDVIERKGRDLVKVGIFNFKVDVASKKVVSKAVKTFDDQLLTALESNPRRSKYFKYKLDYIIPIGDASYYVGEQYQEQMIIERTNYGVNIYWKYEYMDVIVAKLNAKGEFEWIKNSPLRVAIDRQNYRHLFKQYIAVPTSKNLYILNDDHPKNIERYEKADFEAKDLKSVRGIHGSNFVCNTMSLQDGKVTKRQVLMNNEDYCFAPVQERNPQFIPPSDCEIFVPSINNEIFIYTEDKGNDRFAKIKFE